MYQDTLPSALTCQFRSVYPLLSSSHPTFIHCIGSVHPRTHTNINNPHQLYKCSATEIRDLLSNLKPAPIQWRTQQACTLQLQSKTQIEFLSFVWVWLPRYFKICSFHRWSSSLLSLIFHSDFSIADVIVWNSLSEYSGDPHLLFFRPLSHNTHQWNWVGRINTHNKSNGNQTTFDCNV